MIFLNSNFLLCYLLLSYLVVQAQPERMYLHLSDSVRVDAVIFEHDHGNLALPGVFKGMTFFRPSKEDVIRAERLLFDEYMKNVKENRSELDADDPESEMYKMYRLNKKPKNKYGLFYSPVYKRQYVGVSFRGKQYIVINCVNMRTLVQKIRHIRWKKTYIRLFHTDRYNVKRYKITRIRRVPVLIFWASLTDNSMNPYLFKD